MKKIFLGLLIIASIFLVAGCSTKEDITKLEDKISDLESQIDALEKENEALKKQKEELLNDKSNLEDSLSDAKSELSILKGGSYTISVTDIDGELLGSQNSYVNEYSTLFEALTTKFDVNYTTSEYGAYISSINNSIVDPNYYIAIYENGVLASTGIEGLVVDDKDSFEFKVECWNTLESGYGVLDSYDVLVDKLIYHYAKNHMVDSLSKAAAYSLSSYWEMMGINLMSSKGYDKNVFNANALSKEFIDNLNSVDLSTLSNANIGKYYYTMKALNNDLSSFKEFYSSYLTNSLSATYSEWTMPFIMSPAKELDLTSDKLTTLISTDYLASTTFGIDGLAWQVTSLQLFDKYNTDILTNFTAKDYGSGTSTALALLPYAALNENVRNSKYEADGKDLIEILIDNYYDEELNLIKVNKTDTDYNMSSNQIYTALMAYKAQRDLNVSANIFA